MTTAAKGIAAGVIMLFICWYCGVELDERSMRSGLSALLSVIVGIIVYSMEKIRVSEL